MARSWTCASRGACEVTWHAARPVHVQRKEGGELHDASRLGIKAVDSRRLLQLVFIHNQHIIRLYELLSSATMTLMLDRTQRQLGRQMPL